MANAVVTRAFFYGDSGGFFQNLRDFLYRVGYRDSTTFSQLGEIAEALQNNIWPVIFLDSAGAEQFDSLGLLDRFYGTPGFELVPFVVIGTEEDRKIKIYSKGIGARGFLLRPLRPLDATSLLKSLLSEQNEPWGSLALEVSKMLLLRNVDGARNGLIQLAANPIVEKGAEVALLRGEILQGQISRAEDRIVRLLKKFPNDLRIHCEAIDYFRTTIQYAEAIRFLKEIEKTNVLPHRIWDRACLSLEIDDLNGAFDAIEELSKRESFRSCASRGFVQMLLFMGLQDFVPYFLKGSPALGREYAEYLVRIGKVNKGQQA